MELKKKDLEYGIEHRYAALIILTFIQMMTHDDHFNAANNILNYSKTFTAFIRNSFSVCPRILSVFLNHLGTVLATRQCLN
jgi:hypothetical protein